MNERYLLLLMEARDETKEEIEKLDDKEDYKLKIAFARLDGIIQSAELYYNIQRPERIKEAYKRADKALQNLINK